MKLIRCRDHGFDCEFEAHSHSEDEVMQAAAQHATTVHNMVVTAEVVDQVRASIHEVPNLPS